MYYVSDFAYTSLNWKRPFTRLRVVVGAEPAQDATQVHGPFETNDLAMAQVAKMFAPKTYRQSDNHTYVEGEFVCMSAAETVAYFRTQMAEQAVRLDTKEELEFSTVFTHDALKERGQIAHMKTMLAVIDAAWAARDDLAKQRVPECSYSSDEVRTTIRALAKDAPERQFLCNDKPWTSRARGQAMYDLQNRAIEAGFIVLMHGFHVHFAQGVL